MISRVFMSSSYVGRRNRILELFCLVIAAVLCAGMAFGQSINMSNWGTVTAPVYNQAESSPFYSRAEILAGPNKFGTYRRRAASFSRLYRTRARGSASSTFALA
jgi:hypothetical protein